MANGSAVRQAIVEAVGSSGAAGVLSVVTTAGGLLAFSSSDIRTVEDIGIATGFGLLIALVLSLLLVPVIFSWSKGGRPSAARDRVLHGRVLYMRHLAEMVISRRRAFLISGAVLGAAAFAGILQLRADYHYLGTFKRDTSIRREYDAVDSVLHASSVIEVLVDTQAVDGLKEPVVLEQLAELQRGVEDDHRDLGIRAYSIVDVLREINQALGGGKKEEYQLPKTRGAIAETLLLFSMSGNNELSKLSSPDYRTARLTFRMPNVPHSSSAAVIASIEQRVHAFDAAIARAGAQPPVVTITGLVKLWHTIHHYLMSSQLNSLAITLVIVTLVMMLVFRSIRLALVLSALNAFAVFITLGIMGWLSVPIEPYTILLSSIALGLLDDDTIHMVTHLLALRKAGVSLIDGIRETFASMGQAMFCMAGVLIAAFALYFFSSIAGLTKFGLLTALTILIGSFVELFLTPPVLLWLEPWLFKTHAAEAPATTAPHAA